jgi:hypothetical protein
VTSKDEFEKRLGTFCSNKRQDKKNNKLSEDQIKLLETIDGWYWFQDDIMLQKSFDDRYDEFKQWVEENGKMPSFTSEDELERELVSFYNNKREDKKNDKLSKDKIKLLEKIDEWYWIQDDIMLQQTFDESYNDLKKWVEANGKIPSLTAKDEFERKLGSFCNNKRKDKKNNKLSEDQIKLLEIIDEWHWIQDDIILQESFNDRYDDLKTWVDINKRIPSKESKDGTEKSLGYFCDNQKRKYKKNKLNDDKIKKLEKINEWTWNAYNDTFIENYNKLKQWTELNKKLPNERSKDSNEKKLGLFCRTQRSNKKNNKLSTDKIKQLELIDGWYWEDLFNEKYNKLKRWVEVNKNLPKSNSEDKTEKKLGKFCTNLRGNKKKNNLSDDRINKLELIDGWYW